jgi:hypothetical protein
MTSPSGTPLTFSGVQSTDFFRNGAKIQNIGEYIEYSTGAIIGTIGSLNGKNIEIDLDEPLIA